MQETGIDKADPALWQALKDVISGLGAECERIGVSLMKDAEGKWQVTDRGTGIRMDRPMMARLRELSDPEKRFLAAVHNVVGGFSEELPNEVDVLTAPQIAEALATYGAAMLEDPGPNGAFGMAEFDFFERRIGVAARKEAG